MAITTCMSLSPPPLFSISKPKLPYSSIKPHNLSPILNSPCSLPTPLLPPKTLLFDKTRHRKTQFWRIFAAPEDVLLSDTTPLDQQIVSTGDDVTASIIQVLLFIAFVVLSIFTVGVIYIGVTDFLGKREREKFEKEEATKTKSKKRKVKARAGPRGFGQKVNEDDDDLDSRALD